jgi:hypothetical protein
MGHDLRWLGEIGRVCVKVVARVNRPWRLLVGSPRGDSVLAAIALRVSVSGTVSGAFTSLGSSAAIGAWANVTMREDLDIGPPHKILGCVPKVRRARRVDQQVATIAVLHIDGGLRWQERVENRLLRCVLREQPALIGCGPTALLVPHDRRAYATASERTTPFGERDRRSGRHVVARAGQRDPRRPPSATRGRLRP